MTTYRVWKAKIVNEIWCCDVEAESEEEAKSKYDFDYEEYQNSEVCHNEIINVEILKEDEN